MHSIAELRVRVTHRVKFGSHARINPNSADLLDPPLLSSDLKSHAMPKFWAAKPGVEAPPKFCAAKPGAEAAA
jgi:hypothetical protein